MPFRNTHAENNGVHIRDIMSRTDCMKHDAPEGIPCFHVKYDTVNGYSAGLCGARIRKAGFNGRVSHESVQSKKQHEKKRAFQRDRFSGARV